jgi:hypothetical protein
MADFFNGIRHDRTFSNRPEADIAAPAQGDETPGCAVI